MPFVLRLFGPTTKIKGTKGQAKVSKGWKKNRKQCHGCHGLLIFVKTPKTLFTLNNWYLSRSKSVHLSRISCTIANHASHCHVRSRVAPIIWAQPCVTVQIFGPSRVTQKPFPTLCNYSLWGKMKHSA